MSEVDEDAPLFPGIKLRTMSGTKAYIKVKLPDGTWREFNVGTFEPDLTEEKLSEYLGDGEYRVEAIGINHGGDGRRSADGAVLSVRNLPMAYGKPAIWASRIRKLREAEAMASEAGDRSSDDESEADGHSDGPSFDDLRPPFGRHPHRPDMGLPMMDRADMMGMPGMPSSSGSGVPYAVPLGPDENIPIAPGLKPEDQQKILNEARLDYLSRKADMSSTQMLMQLMQQMNDAQAKRAEQAERLIEKMVAGGGQASAPTTMSSEQMESLRLVNEGLRNDLRDAQDRIRDARRDRDDVEREWRQRCADIEQRLRDTLIERDGLRAELRKKDMEMEIQKLASGAGVGTGEDKDFKRKVELVKQIVDSAGPMIMPILAQMMGGAGGGGAPPGMPPGGVPPSGDLPGM